MLGTAGILCVNNLMYNLPDVLGPYPSNLVPLFKNPYENYP